MIKTIFFNARYLRYTVQVLQSCSCGFAATPCSPQITQTQGSRSSGSTWMTSFRAFALGLDVHLSQMAVRQIFSRSLSATALHCETYDNGFFFFSTTEAERGRPDVPSHVICPHFVWSVFWSQPWYGLWTMVDTAVDFFGYVLMLCLPWLSRF